MQLSSGDHIESDSVLEEDRVISLILNVYLVINIPLNSQFTHISTVSHFDCSFFLLVKEERGCNS